MCRKLIANVLNMFKKFMQIFSPKYVDNFYGFGRVSSVISVGLVRIQVLYITVFILLIFVAK